MRIDDIHLAAASLSPTTRSFFEERGFVEDLFRECRNCAPTLYHATFREDSSRINDDLWLSLSSELKADTAFNGLLEAEVVVRRELDARRIVNASFTPPPLAIQPCPSDCQKACDVHIGARIDPHGDATQAWLEKLAIASFRKTRSDGDWRIYTATFDRLDAGIRFFDVIVANAPRVRQTGFRIKIEETVRAVRVPDTAATLPLTYAVQLDSWLDAVAVGSNG
jgi:hypothetical protein